MKRPGIIFLVALVFGALSAAMAYRHLQAQRADIEAARLALRQMTTDVVVAAESIPIGARITAEQVRTVRWPAASDTRRAGVFKGRWWRQRDRWPCRTRSR